MTLPRLLVIMGSGETAPTMVTTHKRVFDRLGPDARAVLLDTPYGFQENADDISDRAVAYFRKNVGRGLTVASAREGAPEAALARIQQAAMVFAGPGSPSYALRQWAGTPLPDLLAEKLRTGGCLTFASAAALTIGVATVPVYEVYKVGEEPRWLPGLDLLSHAGLHAAVIPHFDNAEGGNHDTRYCYLGERRLRLIEPELPDDAFVLGVDEHTALIFDLDAGTAEVTGRGVVTIRRDGRSSTIAAGETVGIDELSAVRNGGAEAPPVAPAPATTEPAAQQSSPLLADADRLTGVFEAALAARDGAAAAGAVLELDGTIESWSGDTLQSDEPDRARAALRSMVVRLGDAAVAGLGDPAERFGPVVEALVEQRDRARAEQRWDDADRLRDRLLAAGIDVRDTPNGSVWEVRRP